MYTPIMQPRGVNSDDRKPAEFTASDIPVIWQELSVALHPAVEQSQGMLSLETIEFLLRNGSATAFGILEGQKFKMALVVTETQYSTYKAARILLLAGEDLREASKFLPVLEAWALMHDCVEIEGWCRDSVCRLLRPLGWEKKTTIVSWDLRRKLQ